MPILKLEHVAKRYGRRWVFSDLNLRLGTGEFVLLVGANGTGKTTLLRLLSTYARPSGGRILWDALEDGGLPGPERIRRSLGVVAHEPLLYDELTILESLVWVLQLHRLDFVHERALRWASAFGLDSRADERVATLSRGLKQRLALARAFAVEPRLLLLDEPGAHLDSKGVELVVDRLRALGRRAAVVLATHAPDPFRPLATRTWELRDGVLHDWGSSP